jgi:radical SAM superfamily enzyme YgiQ (UPF0313 family)
MKVLFVKPKLVYSTLGGLDYSLCEPLEFEQLAAAVPDHDVRILDLRFDPDLEGELAKFKPDIVGTTCMSVNVYAARDILKQVKSLDPSITTVVGGYHATNAPEDVAETFVDAIAIGESVDTLRELVRAMEKNQPLESVPGLALPIASGVVKYTAKRSKVFDFDTQPIPNRKLNPHHRKYFYCEYWQPTAIMRASIGCHARCNFCALWHMTDGKYLAHSVKRVVDEIESIPEKYIFFVDDNFMPEGEEHEARIEGIRTEIKRRNLKKEFYFSTRTDFVARRPDIIERWTEVGLKRTFFGLESHENDRLKALNKGNTEDLNRRAIEVCHANGIAVTGCFIVHPDFTRDDFKRLVDYTASLDLNIAAFLVLTPHPGTVLHTMRRHEIVHLNYEMWDHMHSVFATALPEDEFYNEYAKLWMRAYTPFTWDGARRLTRIMTRASWRQRVTLTRVAFKVFPKIAAGSRGHKQLLYRRLRWEHDKGKPAPGQALYSPHPVLPSLRPEVMTFAPEEELESELKRMVSIGRHLDAKRKQSRKEGADAC